jgi:hypothetical protein
MQGTPDTVRSTPECSPGSGCGSSSLKYPGYGPRDGAPDEETLVADAQQTIALAHRS